MSLFRISTAEGLAWARTATPDVSLEEHVARERAAMRQRHTSVRPFEPVVAPAIGHPAPDTDGQPWPSWEETVLETEHRTRRDATARALPAASSDVPVRPALESEQRAAARAPLGPGRPIARSGRGARRRTEERRAAARRAEDDGRRGQRRLLQVAVLVVGLTAIWRLGMHWTTPTAGQGSVGAGGPAAAAALSATPATVAPPTQAPTLSAAGSMAAGATAAVPGAPGDTAAAALPFAPQALGLGLPSGAALLAETAQSVERPGQGRWLALTAHASGPLTRLVEFYRAQAAQEAASRATAQTADAALSAVAPAGPTARPAASVQESSPGPGQWQLTFHDGADGARRAVLLLQDGDAVRISLSRWVPAPGAPAIAPVSPAVAAAR